VPQEFLNSPDVIVCLEQLRGKCVPQVWTLEASELIFIIAAILSGKVSHFSTSRSGIASRTKPFFRIIAAITALSIIICQPLGPR
jgi:hypothetical protein